MPIHKSQPGLWADTLSAEEVDFSKKAGLALSDVGWAKALLREAKISRALNCVPAEGRTLNSLLEIKSALFEVRFAYAIHAAGFVGKYEHKTGEGGSSVDFLISGKAEQRNWLIELTSLRESEAAKTSSWQNGNSIGFLSRSKPGENSTEVRDIVKTQQAILHKIADHKAQAIKFPMPCAEEYNVIVVDVRALNLGNADKLDFCNIVYGSSSLVKIDHGAYCQTWLDKNGNSALLRGVLDPLHPDPKAIHLQQRVHAIGFMSERDYAEFEINTQISIWPNPHLIEQENKKDFLALFPLSIPN